MCGCYYCSRGYYSLCKSRTKVAYSDCGDPGCDLCEAGVPVRSDLGQIMLSAAELLAVKRKREEEERLRRAQEYAEKVAALPKQAGAIRMLRTWKLTAEGDLKAMIAKHTWKPGENVSLASGGDGEENSGFYGFNSLEELQKQEAEWWEKSQSGEEAKTYEHGYGRGFWYVCGTMLCYGHVKQSAKGGRVQKAIPEYIIEPDGSDPDFGMLVVNAAEKYGMRIITVEQAENLKMGLVPYWRGRPIR